MALQRHGLARVLSKLGWCSRSAAFELIRCGRVTVNGRVTGDPERPTDMSREVVCVDGTPVTRAESVYLMLNKPRGLVTTTRDEQGRETVYECLAAPAWNPADGSGIASLAAKPAGFDPQRVMPVGRLDRASEGLLLFSNDTAWAARLTDPASGILKTYHVQVNALPDRAFLARLVEGVEDAGERLAARSARVLRAGHRNAWLEVELNEGKNRHVRRMMAALGAEVLRLVRVRIGTLELGELPKGRYRVVPRDEAASLA